MTEAYRVPGQLTVLEEVSPLRCEDCRHGERITHRWTDRRDGSLMKIESAIGCMVRALESLKPHQSEQEIVWKDFGAEKFNDEGQCERWEAPPLIVPGWMTRLWAWVWRKT